MPTSQFLQEAKELPKELAGAAHIETCNKSDSEESQHCHFYPNDKLHAHVTVCCISLKTIVTSMSNRTK